MVLPLSLTVLLALGAPASAMNVRVPTLPAKFTGGNYSAAWRTWEAPLLNTYVAARGEKLSLTPQLEAFAPVTGAAKKDGAPAPFAARSSALYLLTVQLEAAGIKPTAFAAWPAAERVQKMQEAYDVLRGELQTAGEGLAKAAEDAAKVGDRGALNDAQSRLSLLVASHGDYIDPKVMTALRGARDKAFAAHAQLTDTVVDGAAKSGEAALKGATADGAQGYAALGDSPDPWRGATPDPNTAARKHLLAPLKDGKIPADFIEAFGRYQQMGDSQLSLDALKAFKPAVDNPFVNGPDAARALAGIGLIAREAPAERARNRALQALIKNRFLAPELESLRVFTLRDVGVAAADKEVMARVLKSLAADAGVKREGPAGEALSAVEAVWKKTYGIPPPAVAEKHEASGAKWTKKGMTGLLTGLIPVAMAWVGWFPTAMPSWLPFLSFLNPFMPFMPYVGLVMALAYLAVGYYYKSRAR